MKKLVWHGRDRSRITKVEDMIDELYAAATTRTSFCPFTGSDSFRTRHKA